MIILHRNKKIVILEQKIIFISQPNEAHRLSHTILCERDNAVQERAFTHCDYLQRVCSDTVAMRLVQKVVLCNRSKAS